MRRDLVEELRAAGLALGGLALGIALALAVAGHSTAEGRARRLAADLGARARADDLLILPAALGRGEADRGRLLFPFRPFSAVLDDGDAVALDSVPFARVLFGPGVEPGGWTGAPTAPLTGGIRSLELGDPADLLLSRIDYRGVRVQSGLTAQPCDRRHPSGGVRCGDADWFHVGPAVLRVGEQQRLCLWAHPPPAGQTLQIPVKLPARSRDRRLELQLRFTDAARRDARHAPVQLAVRADDARLGALSCDNRAGSCGLSLDLAAGPAGQLLLELDTDDNGRQLLCLDGRFMDAAAAAGER